MKHHIWKDAWALVQELNLVEVFLLERIPSENRFSILAFESSRHFAQRRVVGVILIKLVRLVFRLFHLD